MHPCGHRSRGSLLNICTRRRGCCDLASPAYVRELATHSRYQTRGVGQAAHGLVGTHAAPLRTRTQVWMLDLASLASVREFATRWEAQGRELNILINNAGIYSMNGVCARTDAHLRVHACGCRGVQAGVAWPVEVAYRGGPTWKSNMETLRGNFTS